MEKLLQAIGWLGLGAVALILLLMVASAGPGPYSIMAFVPALPWAAPAIIGFVLIAAFGSMLGQLKGIRAATERQAELFQSILDRRPKP